jgi:hypothetical protein
MNVVISLDVVDVPLELGRTYVLGGFVDVALDTLVGPAGHPVVSVTGTPGAVLDWTMINYTREDLPAALEIMATATPAGE